MFKYLLVLLACFLPSSVFADQLKIKQSPRGDSKFTTTISGGEVEIETNINEELRIKVPWYLSDKENPIVYVGNSKVQVIDPFQPLVIQGSYRPSGEFVTLIGNGKVLPNFWDGVIFAVVFVVMSVLVIGGLILFGKFVMFLARLLSSGAQAQSPAPQKLITTKKTAIPSIAPSSVPPQRLLPSGDLSTYDEDTDYGDCSSSDSGEEDTDNQDDSKNSDNWPWSDRNDIVIDNNRVYGSDLLFDQTCGHVETDCVGNVTIHQDLDLGSAEVATVVHSDWSGEATHIVDNDGNKIGEIQLGFFGNEIIVDGDGKMIGIYNGG